MHYARWLATARAQKMAVELTKRVAKSNEGLFQYLANTQTRPRAVPNQRRDVENIEVGPLSANYEALRRAPFDEPYWK